MSARLRSRRERIAWRLPVAFLEYPFEILLASAAVSVGVPLAFGYVRPGSLVETLPEFGLIAWGVATLLGGLTILTGLAHRCNKDLISVGNRLLAGLFFIYAVSVMTMIGPGESAVAAALCLVVSVLAAFRAFILRTLSEAEHNIRREG